MIACCVTNQGDALPASSFDSRRGFTAETEFAVTPGRDYPVFCITVFLGTTWYYVLNDDGQDYPVWAPAALFDIVDGNIPNSWMVGYFRFPERQYPLISFPEWATDPGFYERLVDDQPEAVRIFAMRRAEVEAPQK